MEDGIGSLLKAVLITGNAEADLNTQLIQIHYNPSVVSLKVHAIDRRCRSTA